MPYKHSGVRPIALLIALLTLFSLLPFTATAEEIKAPSMAEADAVYLYHIEREEVILSKNAAQSIPAGSTAKIMSGLLFCEALSDRLEESVEITSEMLAEVGGRILKIKAGDVLTVEQLLYIALCGSYNDAYDILAFYVAGSLSDFVARMNTHANELGATETSFADASGIADASRTTGENMAKIALAAYRNSLYMQITSTTRYNCAETLKMSAQVIANRNALIYSTTTTAYHNELCRGMNAGNTQLAGSCVVTSASNGTDSYLSIVMGAQERDNRDFGYLVTNRLLDWVYDTFTYMEVITPDTLICTLPVTVSDMTSEVEVRTKESLSCYLPAGLELGKDITYSVRLTHTSLEAPVAEGMMVGYVAVLYDGKTIDALPIYTAGSAERSSFISSIKSLRALTESRVFRAGALFFLVTMTAWITTEYIILQRRRHKWDKYFSMKMNPSPTAPDRSGGNNKKAR